MQRIVTNEWTDSGKMEVKKNVPLKMAPDINSSELRKSCKHEVFYIYKLSSNLNVLTHKNKYIFFIQILNHLKSITNINVLSRRKYTSYKSILSQCQLLLCFIIFMQIIPPLYTKYHKFYSECTYKYCRHHKCAPINKLEMKAKINPKNKQTTP